ncbi:MAG: hypothetical protein NTZ33_13950 [Bacteroidetes bacterium]|nr:hypothetical protein [Bacteroidota bacterium]
MKKVLFIVLVIILSGCKGVIDKKINKESFINDLKDIQLKYSNEYTSSDINELSDKGFSMYILNTAAENITYKQALDKIKSYRIEKELKIKSINDAVSIKFIDKGNLSNDDLKFNLFKLLIENKSKKDIKGLKFSIVIKNMFDNEIAIIDEEKTELLKANSKNEIIKKQLVSDVDLGSSTIFNTDISKLKITYIINIVLFSDDSKIEIPQ